MKKYLFLPLLLALVFCNSNKDNNAPVCGGYSELRLPTEEETSMFESLFKDSTDMQIKPVKVRTQVVGGMNYDFQCEKMNTDSTWSSVYVRVFQPLPGEGDAEITSIRLVEKIDEMLN